MRAASSGEVIYRMRKYADVEKVTVLNREEQAEIAARLANMGKTSAVQLTDQERKALDTATR